MSARVKLKRHKRALAAVRDLVEQPDTVRLIHYSCESFYDRVDGTSPRITSIAVRNFGLNQTTSFSVHLIAEREPGETTDVGNDYDLLERKMLDEFFDYARQHQNHKWVHWNMRDVNYGFAALEHRHRVLGGSPFMIPEGNRLDLAATLIHLYGPQYAGHPRLIQLVDHNDISTKDLLSGAAEAEAFNRGDYIRLHQSTLRKVDIFVTIIDRILDGSLKTKASWRAKYGTTVGGIVEAVTDHWLYKLVGAVAIVASLALAIMRL